jgi:hypothetical protein
MTVRQELSSPSDNTMDRGRGSVAAVCVVWYGPAESLGPPDAATLNAAVGVRASANYGLTLVKRGGLFREKLEDRISDSAGR